MAAHLTTRTAPTGAITVYRLVNFFSSIGTQLAAWNDARITRKSLDKLTDHELDDIGLCRGDIEDIAHGRI
jgi:uncharacterized protein YjiS (DUF1127 family)